MKQLKLIFNFIFKSNYNYINKYYNYNEEEQKEQKKSFKIIKGKEEEKLTSHIEKNLKKKILDQNRSYFKNGIVALPLIYKSIIESQQWDEWSAWQLN